MLEIYFDCPLEICEARDVKGMYKKARAGLIKNHTGISSSYEAPVNPDLRIDTANKTLSECIAEIVDLLTQRRIVFHEKNFD